MPADSKLCEKIARRWCELMKLDSDELVQHGAEPAPNGYIPDVALCSPRWIVVAREVPGQLAWVLAIGESV